jgi:hypothetical protein
MAPLAVRAAQAYALNYVENLLVNHPPGRPAPPQNPSDNSSQRPVASRLSQTSPWNR